MPQMLDPNFSGAIIYICEHNEDGAMGIIINRPIKLSLNDILEQLEFELSPTAYPVYWGGPVQEDRGFIIHTAADNPEHAEGAWESSLEVSPDIHLTTSKDILKAIAQNKGPDNFMVALGYAGWGDGQLEQELTDNTWLCSPADAEILFDQDFSAKRQRAMTRLGVTEHQLNAQIGHA